MDIFDRLANLFKSFVNDTGDDDPDDASFGSSKRQFIDPDEQAAWEELNDYLNNDDAGPKKTNTHYEYTHSSNSQNSQNYQKRTDPTLEQDFKNLELRNGASFEEVKTAYKTLLRKYHPDKHANDPEKLKYATEFTKKINQSFMRIKKHYNKN